MEDKDNELREAAIKTIRDCVRYTAGAQEFETAVNERKIAKAALREACAIYNGAKLDFDVVLKGKCANQQRLMTNKSNIQFEMTLNEERIRKLTALQKGMVSCGISKDMVKREMHECLEQFNEQVLRYYTRKSMRMQMNDKQMVCFKCDEELMAIFNIDLHFKNGDRMYLIAMLQLYPRIRYIWRVTDFMNATKIAHQYRVHQLPGSSRQTVSFKKELKRPPIGVNADIMLETNFKALSVKFDHDVMVGCIEYHLKRCHDVWNEGIVVPVVVFDLEERWIEWENCMTIQDENGKKRRMAISLRYHEADEKWMIGHINFALGALYYDHKLTGSNHEYCYTYDQLMGREAKEVETLQPTYPHTIIPGTRLFKAEAKEEDKYQGDTRESMIGLDHLNDEDNENGPNQAVESINNDHHQQRNDMDLPPVDDTVSLQTELQNEIKDGLRNGIIEKSILSAKQLIQVAETWVNQRDFEESVFGNATNYITSCPLRDTQDNTASPPSPDDSGDNKEEKQDNGAQNNNNHSNYNPNDNHNNNKHMKQGDDHEACYHCNVPRHAKLEAEITRLQLLLDMHEIDTTSTNSEFESD
eukprot:469829_1